MSSDVVVLKNSGNLPLVLEDNSLFSYLNKIKLFPILSEKEEQSLLIDFQQNNNLESAHKLITSHLRLAAKISFNYKRYGLPLADIISEANIGLMQAVKKFDLSKKVRLSTYAMWWIRASINDYVLRSWSLVKIGTVAAQKKLFYNLNKIKARLGIYENIELEPKVVKEIATELVVGEQDVIDMNRRMGGDSSLNVAVNKNEEDSGERIDFIVDKKQDLEAKVIAKDESKNKKEIIAKAMSELNDREKYIIKNRMLVDEPLTLEEISDTYQISRERVRQIEKRAFEKLSQNVKKQFA